MHYTSTFYIRTYCSPAVVQHVNENAIESFKSEDNTEELFTQLQKVFLPCFYGLVCSTSTKDHDAIEQVRSCWCEVLSVDHAGLLLYLL